jgi:N-acetylglucosamine kinase-like BadF-type ATPase
VTRHLAIDAGQTGIRTRLIDDGVAGAETESPGILTSQPLIPQLAQVIRDAVAGPVDTVSIGSTGLTAEETDPAALRELSGAGWVLMAHDSVTSYLGALGDTRGAVVAAGTGVVTLAVGAHEVARVDGWGNLIGDAGAGYWIGRAGLEAVMRDYDGRGPATALTAVVQRDFPDLSQAYIELQADPGRVRRIAGYTRAVADLAAEGDPVAQHICGEAAGELALSIETGLRRVGEAERPDPVVCGVGGVLRADAIAGPFRDLLRRRWERVDIREPLGAGIDGAALLPDVPAGSALYALIARA